MEEKKVVVTDGKDVVELIDKPDTVKIEGLPDPTANAAIKNVMKKTTTYEVGAVYSITNANGYSDDVLIMGNLPGFVNCLVVMEDTSPYITDDCISFMYYGKKRFINSKMIMTRPSKYIQDKLFILDYAIFDAVKSEVAAQLDIALPPTRSVDKVKSDFKRQIDAVKEAHRKDLLEQEARIYKEICMGIIARGK